MRPKAQHRKKEIDVTGLSDEAIRAVQSVVSLLRAQAENKPASAKKMKDKLLGLFRDEPELLDQLVEEASPAHRGLSRRGSLLRFTAGESTARSATTPAMAAKSEMKESPQVSCRAPDSPDSCVASILRGKGT
jgi:hypothetical protein